MNGIAGGLKTVFKDEIVLVSQGVADAINKHIRDGWEFVQAFPCSGTGGQALLLFKRLEVNNDKN